MPQVNVLIGTRPAACRFLLVDPVPLRDVGAEDALEGLHSATDIEQTPTEAIMMTVQRL
jgi:hypothetical protein